jgi:hypothetical protein
MKPQNKYLKFLFALANKGKKIKEEYMRKQIDGIKKEKYDKRN